MHFAGSLGLSFDFDELLPMVEVGRVMCEVQVALRMFVFRFLIALCQRVFDDISSLMIAL